MLQEAELKDAHGMLDDMGRQKHEVEDTVRRKESEISNLQAVVEAEQNNVTKAQRHIKDLGQKNSDIEEELDNERNAKMRLDKVRGELEAQIAQYEDQIEEAGGANTAAVSSCCILLNCTIQCDMLRSNTPIKFEQQASYIRPWD